MDFRMDRLIEKYFPKKKWSIQRKDHFGLNFFSKRIEEDFDGEILFVVQNFVNR